MSRQRGRRDTPKPAKEAYVASLKVSRRDRARARAAAPAASADGTMLVTRRRRWAAVALATFFIVFAFGSLLTSIQETDNGNPGRARIAMLVAAVLSIVSVGVLSVVSRGPRALRMVFLTGPAAIGLFMIIAALLREPATPLVAAFGVAGVFALRPAPGGSTRKRLSYVLLGTAVSAVGYLLSPPAAATLAPLLPYFLVMVADVFANKRSGLPMDERVGPPEESVASEG